MSKPIIAAGIVLFNPDDLNRLEACINSVLSQIDKVYIFDNSTVEWNRSFDNKVMYLTENENKGIAYALNRIMKAAQNDGFDWVITMDQDSILPAGIKDRYIEAIKKHDKIGIVCPQVIDSRRAYMVPKTEPEEELIDECITSASCTSIKVWEKIGKFDEWLFIDLVDNEFCKRLTCSGYQILRINSLVLNQEFGKIIPKSEKVQKFWINIAKLLKNENFAKFSYKKFVSPMRVYYTNRNIIYVNKKMRRYGCVGYSNYNCKNYLGFLICFSLPSFLRAQDKMKVLKAIVDGMKDGHSMKVEEWTIKR